MDSMRQAHSLESLEMVGRDRGHSQDTPQLLGQPVRSSEGAGLVLRSGPPSPTHQEPINIRLLDRKQPMRAECLDYMPPAPSPRPQNAPPPLRLDVDEAGRTVPLSAWLPPSWVVPSCSDSCSLQFGPNHLQPARGRQDLVKSHLMLAVREEVELLREQIRELQEKNQQLERENHILRTLTHNKHTT
ncbi:hypothetical protein INR49_008930 [Caranx melampygus]|nr:hypothetical protein INR49_008930 [Caranx melampygus]